MSDTIEFFCQDNTWMVKDHLGTWFVTVLLKGNGWSIDNIYTDGPASASYEIAIESFGENYLISIDAEYNSIEQVNGGNCSSFKIATGHPVLQFFRKSNGEETIGVLSNFDRQRY